MGVGGRDTVNVRLVLAVSSAIVRILIGYFVWRKPLMIKGLGEVPFAICGGVPDLAVQSPGLLRPGQ